LASHRHTNMSDDQFLTTEQVLDYLQVNLRTVYRLIKAGRIPAVRVGRQWLFRRSDIDGWLDSSRQMAHGDVGQDSSDERPRVLVVDDEPAVRDLLAKALAGADYDVDVAVDGASAVEHLRSRVYDLLITDLRMPGMDGLSVIRQARRTAPDLPVIIITGYSTEAAAIEAINLGVSGYITKPFRLPRILAATARALGEPVPAAEA
jgi:excisionase family DNA binding protein